MYDPANRKLGRASERSSEIDFVMFGFYISNNIGVGFRTFAGGISFGLGSVLFLLFNGLVNGGSRAPDPHRLSGYFLAFYQWTRCI
uniref:stage II sporulation protein M n=1 Tax=Candidatus Vondammii sp. HM_W22 TaxID=2687299 RepID=UPI001F144F76|nr:stage II sporulation protein M [Candidatus Vondammii sp. HM_W22]